MFFYHILNPSTNSLSDLFINNLKIIRLANIIKIIIKEILEPVSQFLACKNYPECTGTKPYLEKIGMPCPDCEDGEVIIRRSKKGRIFYGCSNFPNCSFVSWNRPTGKKCPECQENLVEKVTKKGTQIVCSSKTCSYKEEVKQ